MAGYASSSLGIFDTESGKCVQTMHAQAAPTHTADPDSQINKVVAHGRMGLVITGHEDHTIRFWDPRTGGTAPLAPPSFVRVVRVVRVVSC